MLGNLDSVLTRTLTDHLTKQPPGYAAENIRAVPFSHSKDVIHSHLCRRFRSDSTAWNLQGVVVNEFVDTVGDTDKWALSQTPNAT